LSYANEHRPAAMYEDLFWAALNRFRNQGSIGGLRKSRFRFKNKLLSLDSTTISLCLSLFPWAKFRQAKGGVKLHVLLDHDDYMPAFIHITEAKPHDRRAAQLLTLATGSIVAMDRAYNDYRLFSDWTDRGVFFVTRMKDNAVYEVVEEKPLPQKRNILADQVIRLTGAQADAKCSHLLRRVVVQDEEHNREIVLLTNHLEFGSTTISAIYKERWEIEVFFKTLKQNLKVKTFVGTSENALRIQIWTALIAILLLKWLHHISKAGWSLSNLAAMLRMNLFTYRELRAWIDSPFNTPPTPLEPQQLALPST
ncbi:MAG: IS4 family transposase, partial [Magnetococcales bacterium]|nr:IS4 family transposase [Magnetococcales bacterium]